MKRVMVILGTRPEGIKMAPVIKELKKYPEFFEVKVCSTGQHREMLGQVLDFFGIVCDYTLDVMTPNQTLADVTCKVLKGMEKLFLQWRPNVILVQGDTTTVLSAALAAFYHKIEVGHVEAGLRTGNIYSPWPEEMNRLLASRMATVHFAPTEGSKKNLLREAVAPEAIHVTGNTVIAALFEAIALMDANVAMCKQLDEKFDFIDPSKRLILVTGHRRENFGDGFLQICQAVIQIASRNDVQVVYPVHLNPKVSEPVNEFLGKFQNIHLIVPQDYPSFLYLMRKSHLILTDSGGVQEEAPSLGKPVVVMRDTTERPEAVLAGTVVLSGPHQERIVSEVSRLLDDATHYDSMAQANNPYGDGKAAQRIRAILSGA